MKLNDEYMKFLEQIITCINHGDYYSAKELSNIELERVKQEEVRNKSKNIKIFNKMEKDELKYVSNEYSECINNIIQKSKSVYEIKEKTIKLNEFIIKNK